MPFYLSFSACLRYLTTSHSLFPCLSSCCTMFVSFFFTLLSWPPKLSHSLSLTLLYQGQLHPSSSSFLCLLYFSLSYIFRHFIHCSLLHRSYHSTSKISQVGSLWHLKSYNFSAEILLSSKLFLLWNKERSKA